MGDKNTDIFQHLSLPERAFLSTVAKRSGKEQLRKYKIDILSSTFKFGINPAVPNDATEDIWDGGGTYGFYPATAEAVRIFSAEEDDTFGGDGAQTVRVFGQGIGGIPQQEDVNLDGETKVTLAKLYRRINRMQVIFPDSATVSNLGDLTLETVAASTTCAIILVGNNQTLMALYSLPLGRYGTISKTCAGTGKNEDASVSLFIRPPGEVFQIRGNLRTFENTSWLDLPPNGINVLAPLTDIVMRASSDTSNALVNAHFQLLEVDISGLR